MNLKLVVASMSVLGLVSCPVFAETQATDTQTTDTQAMTAQPKATHHTKHRHRHKVRHTAPASEAAAPVSANYKDYKDMGVICTMPQTAVIMDESNQNVGRSLPNPCNPGWFNRLAISGGVNVDLGKFGNRNTNYMGENYQRFSLNDAYLNVAATVNDWARAFASISYNTATVNAPETAGLVPNAEYSAAYSNNVTSGGNSALQLEQAFATFGNFDVSPFFLQVGKQFQDFSRYEIHPITRSLTQVMSETLATSAKLGFIVPMGFHGDIFAFDDPLAKVGENSNTTNYGAALGYDSPSSSDQFGWDIGAAYMYNMIGANDVAYMVNQYNVLNGIAGGGYHQRVAATALYADVNSGPFTLGARYTTALQRFSCNTAGTCDLAENGNPLVFTTNSLSGAKPWAAGITGGYDFEGWGRNQNVYVGYQASRQAAALDIPKSRWMLGYGIEMFGRNTELGVEWDHDMAYNNGNGGTNNNTNLVSVRSSVKFG